MKCVAFSVWLNDEHIDTVFFVHTMTASEVKKSLIEHDGYDLGIVVYKQRIVVYKQRKDESMPNHTIKNF